MSYKSLVVVIGLLMTTAAVVLVQTGNHADAAVAGSKEQSLMQHADLSRSVSVNQSDCVEALSDPPSASLPRGVDVDLLWDGGEDDVHMARPARCKRTKIWTKCRVCNMRTGSCTKWMRCYYYRYECDPNQL